MNDSIPEEQQNGVEEPTGTEEPADTGRHGDRPDPETPSDDELRTPSTEKEPDEEPIAERPHDPDPDHQAVGIGVVDGPQTTATGGTQQPGTGS